MAVSLAYTALVSVQEVQQDALKSYTYASATDAVKQAIMDATEAIEEHLGRALIVRKTTQNVASWQWRSIYDDRRFIERTSVTGAETCYVFAQEWPLLEVSTVSPTGLTTTIAPFRDETRRLILTDSPQDAVLTTFTGYRRPDQVLASPATGQTDLNSVTDPDDASVQPLSALTVLPPVVPGLIRRRAVELALFYLGQAASGSYGRGRRMQQVGGGQMAVIEAVDVDYEQRLLRSLDGYRRV